MRAEEDNLREETSISPLPTSTLLHVYSLSRLALTLGTRL